MTSGSSGYKTVSRYNVIGGNFGLFMASEAEKLLQELDILLENLSESSIPPIPPSDEERAKTYSEVGSTPTPPPLFIFMKNWLEKFDG